MNTSFKPRVEMLEDRLVMSGTRLASVTDLVIDHFDPARSQTDQVAVVREAPRSLDGLGRILIGADGGIWRSLPDIPVWKVVIDVPNGSPPSMNPRTIYLGTGETNNIDRDTPSAQPLGWFNEGPTPLSGRWEPPTDQISMNFFKPAVGGITDIFAEPRNRDTSSGRGIERVEVESFQWHPVIDRADPIVAVSFAGGWGASSYQYSFQGAYGNTAAGSDGILSAQGAIGGHGNDSGDVIGIDYRPMDHNGHGTHVAGTIGAIGKNAAGHELGHALGFRHEHTRPASSDDVWVDGNIITGDEVKFSLTAETPVQAILIGMLLPAVQKVRE